MAEARVDEVTLRQLAGGELPWSRTLELMRAHKDKDRFRKWRALVQQAMGSDCAVVLPLGEHLAIVNSGKGLTVRCFCGFDFGDYRSCWKMRARIYVRDSEESLRELYPGRRACDPSWMEIREFICPQCATLLEVEAVPPGYPVVFDFLPDIERFYGAVLGEPIPSFGSSRDGPEG